MLSQKILKWKFCLVLILFILLVTVYFNFNKLTYQNLNQVAGYYGKSMLREIPYKVPLLPKSRDLVVIYNRVPKTGSTSFVNVAYDLCKKNSFKVLHINVTGNEHLLSLKNQIEFVNNVTEWMSVKPALYHGHMAYIDFSKFRIEKLPLYINIIRKPLDRMISYYYFIRNGDNYRPHLVRRKHGNKLSFDECVAKNLSDCNSSKLWLQIPFFCGHVAACWEPGNNWALQEAKRNLVRNYFAVGVTEELEDFVRLMEKVLPKMFKGATETYLNGNKSHLRETSKKIVPTMKTISKIQKTKIWQMEQEFYDFTYQQYKFSLKRLNLKKKRSEIEQVFFYEKIRPK